MPRNTARGPQANGIQTDDGVRLFGKATREHLEAWTNDSSPEGIRRNFRILERILRLPYASQWDEDDAYNAMLCVIVNMEAGVAWEEFKKQDRDARPKRDRWETPGRHGIYPPSQPTVVTRAVATMIQATKSDQQQNLFTRE
jgi:UDP-N-acetylmuramyl pentapeptide synthase